MKTAFRVSLTAKGKHAIRIRDAGYRAVVLTDTFVSISRVACPYAKAKNVGMTAVAERAGRVRA